MEKNYSKSHDRFTKLMGELGSKIPTTMKAFGDLHGASMKDGALTSKTKELIAVGIAIAIRCDGCIVAHVKDALKAGVTSEEMMETIGVAVMMGGGPAVVYGCEAMEALKQFGDLKS